MYRRHVGSVFRRARQMLGNDADAEEVVHDVFLSLFERPAQFGGRSSVATFLWAATTHACLTRLRNERTRARLLREREAPLPSDVAKGLSAEDWVALRARLAALPPPLADVAVYYYLDELTQDEIALVVGCSRSHVGNLLKQIQRQAQDGVEVTC
jgi:RNA polymerase sigma-70 factor (ECF subfamily)